MKTVIEVNELGKQYRLGTRVKQAETFVGAIKDAVMFPFQNYKAIRNLTVNGKDEENVFWALKDISFTVDAGDVVGVIGRNGAGKSTLLKILSRITEPTLGSIRIHGRIASLLEVGTGFHPELTGRDNVYMNGTILGMRKKEINARFDEIVEFSGVSKFIDTPVKFYSSGMKVRLGFAVAAHLDPEILVVDEVLAVGDAEFQKKCLGKMHDVSNQGRTILFVSHNISAIKSLTKNALFLENGRLQIFSSTENAVNAYLSSKQISSYGQWHNDESLGESIDVTDVRLLNGAREITNEFDATQAFYIEIDYVVREWDSSTVIALIVHARDESLLFSTEEGDYGDQIINSKVPGKYSSIVEIPNFLLNQGEYYIRLSYGRRGKETFVNKEILNFSLIHTDESKMKGYKKGAYLNPRLQWRTTVK